MHPRNHYRLDIWFPSSPNVKPQIADQVAVGYFRNFKANTIETSVEVYYKNIRNDIDFKDHAELLLNRLFEGESPSATIGSGWKGTNYNEQSKNSYDLYHLSGCA